MPRKGRIAKRTVLADPIYNSRLVTKLISHLVIDGKKAKAPSILYDAFSVIQDKIGKEPLGVFEEAMNNVMPALEVRACRISGSSCRASVEVRPERRTTLGLGWLISHIRLRSEHTMDKHLADEIIDALNDVGSAVKKREDAHRMAEADRALAYYCF